MPINLVEATTLIIAFTILISYIIAQTFVYFENRSKCSDICKGFYKYDFWHNKCYCGVVYQNNTIGWRLIK